jgi:DNA gyrase subunit A
MRFVPGPDLPSGARIVGLDGIREAYATGRGSFRMRATAAFEQVTPRRRGIVITELPYNVGIERVMQRIKDLYSAKKIVGISGMTDLTDGDQGMRLLIEVKSGIDPEALLEQLYRMTPLEEQFSINAVALVDGAPETLGLKQMLEVFLAHRREVVRRRSEFRRAKAADRLHLVEGLLVAILDIDEVIAVIRSSDDAAQAKVRLMEIFALTDAQTTYILDMPLRRLTKYSRIELESERDSLQATIAELTRLLDDPAVLTAAVSDELTEVASRHATPRRTVLLEEAARPAKRDGQMSLELADEPCVVVLSATGLVARLPLPEGPVTANRGAHAVLLTALTTSTRSDFGVVTNTGRLVRMPVVDLPSMPPTATAPSLVGATDAAAFAHLPDGERVVGVVALDDRGFALGTAGGVVKRVAPDAPANKADWPVISLKDGDEVLAAAVCDDDDELVFVTSAGSLLHFPADVVRPQGRNAAGVAGVKLTAGARVVAFAVADEETDLVVTVAVGARGAKSAKVTPLAEYPTKGRATAGVRVQRLLSGEREVLLAAVGPAPAACNAAGARVVLPAQDPRRDASGASVSSRLAFVGGGSRVFRLAR